MTRQGRVRRARSCGGRACIPATSWTGGGPGTAGRWRDGRPRGCPAADPRDAQIARLQKEKARLEQELAGPADPGRACARAIRSAYPRCHDEKRLKNLVSHSYTHVHARPQSLTEMHDGT